MFLHPLMLAGLGAVAAPIVLHLIMRQKPRHLVFPALQFLRRRQQQNRRKLLLRHLLLLLLRILALACLAFALARPTITGAPAGWVDQRAPVAAAMVFDTSPRMSYVYNNQTRLEAAQETASWLGGQLPDDSELAVLDSSLTLARFEVDLPEARRRLERLRIDTRSYPLSLVLDKALDLLEEKPELRRELYLFTDLTQAAWTSASLSRIRERLESPPLQDVGLYIIDVGVEDPQNFALQGIRLTSEIVSRNTPVRLRAELSRTGQSELSFSESLHTRVVKLLLKDQDGQLQQKDQRTIEVAEDGSSSLEFPLTGLPEGVHQGELQLSGNDALALDNRRFFTLEVRPAWRVLLVGKDAKSVQYLREALAPEEFRRRQQARYQCDVWTYAEFAAKVEKRPLAGQYTAVCLVDPTANWPDATWDALKEYVYGGGGLAVFLGRNVDSFRDRKYFNSQAPQELLPGELLQVAQAGGDPRFFNFSDPSHPVASQFAMLKSAVPWQQLPVWNYWQFDELDDDVQTVIRYNNGEAALTEQSIGRGRVLVMSTTVADPPSREDAWNVLVEGWPFVMLADRLVLHLAGSLEGQFNYRVGQPARLPLPTELPQTQFALTLPDETTTTIASTPSESFLVVPQTMLPGNSVVQASVEGKLLRLGFSVNYAPSESQLTRLDADELSELLGDRPFQTAREREEIEQAQSYGRVGWELFPWLMVFLVMILVCESVVSNWFYRETVAR